MINNVTKVKKTFVTLFFRNVFFLKKNNLAHYAQLAHVIQAKIRREGDEGTNIFKSGPYKG